MGSDDVGGLVGYNWDSSTISHSYATGSVTGDDGVGGLVGLSDFSTISHSYATGSVTGTEDVGGLVGYNFSSTISHSYWNTDTSEQASSAGGEGKNDFRTANANKLYRYLCKLEYRRSLGFWYRLPVSCAQKHA